MDQNRLKTIIVLEESAKVLARLNPDVFAIMTFLGSTVRDHDEKDLARWVAFYAKKMFDSKYGAGAADHATKILKEEQPQNVNEFIAIMEDFFDNH